MFSVIFEVQPKPSQWDAYFAGAKTLRPELEKVEGFVDNIRYRSLTREGWILSLSNWRDEKAVVRWRTTMRHHEFQVKGRTEIFLDYRLRVGQVTQDTQLPEGFVLQEQRLDETEVGSGTTVTLVNATQPAEWKETSNAADCAEYFGLDPRANGLMGWDVLDAVLTPGDLILILSWRDKGAAQVFEDRLQAPQNARLRQVRVIRDYGLFDRREAPQYYPNIKRGA
jgi:heme-degrading monooxygenase HmoA